MPALSLISKSLALPLHPQRAYRANAMARMRQTAEPVPAGNLALLAGQLNASKQG